MKLLSLTFLAFSFCGLLQHSPGNKAPNPRAISLERKASLLIMANDNPHKLDSAIVLLKNAIAIDPAYALAYSQLAITYWRQKTYSSALTSMKQFTELEPKNPEALAGYGMMLEVCKKTEKAYKYYQTAANLNREKLKHMDISDKQYLAVQVNYAYNLKLLNKQDESNKIINSVLKDHPNYSPARIVKNYSRVELLKSLK